jgi:anti-sigma factor RsiW
MTHDEIVQLLGAFALDAVDPDEAQEIRAHLVDCPRCSAEVAEHWEVTGLIANVGVDAPAALWDRIAARIDERPAGARRPAPLRLASGPALGPSPRDARRRLAWSAVGTVAAAAAVVAILLGVQVGRLDQRVGQLANASRQTGISQAVQAALLDPGAKTVALTATDSSSKARAAVVVVLPDGSAFMLNTALPRLAADRTYQLWGVVNGQTVSLGVLGSQPHDVAFTVDPGAPVKVFAVTDEVAGGVVRSTHSPVALGTAA